MARKSVIEQHPQKKEIIDEILNGKSFRAIACQYGNKEHPVSRESVRRYVETVMKLDLSAYLQQKRTEQNLRTIDGCVREIEAIANAAKARMYKWQDALDKTGDQDASLRRDLLLSMKAVRESIESLGKFLGMVNDVTVVNNISVESSKFVDRVAGILEEELKDYPELFRKIKERIIDGR